MNHGITTLWVALGTALGGLLRFSVDQLTPAALGVPWNTLTVNTLGSILIGWIAAHATDPSSRLAHASVHAFLVPGFCAGLTTFSVFSHQTLTLLRAGDLPAALFNVTATLVLMVAGAALGMVAGRRTRRHGS